MALDRAQKPRADARRRCRSCFEQRTVAAHDETLRAHDALDTQAHIIRSTPPLRGDRILAVQRGRDVAVAGAGYARIMSAEQLGPAPGTRFRGKEAGGQAAEKAQGGEPPKREQLRLEMNDTLKPVAWQHFGVPDRNKRASCIEVPTPVAATRSARPLETTARSEVASDIGELLLPLCAVAAISLPAIRSGRSLPRDAEPRHRDRPDRSPTRSAQTAGGA
jgi:hypothetical protein